MPNSSGYPTETNINFIRHWIERQHVNVSQFDRIRLCQWLRQLLKHIDKQKVLLKTYQDELHRVRTAENEVAVELERLYEDGRVKRPLEFPEDRDKLVQEAIEADEANGGFCSAGNPNPNEIDTWNDDGGK